MEKHTEHACTQGCKTSEMALTVVSEIIGVLGLMGVFGSGAEGAEIQNAIVQLAGAVVVLLSTLGYVKSRTDVKKAEIQLESLKLVEQKSKRSA